MKDVILIFLFLFLCSCGKQSDGRKYNEYVKPTLEVTSVDTLDSWNLTTDFKTTFFEDEIDSIRFIRLETNDSILLGSVSAIKRVGDKLIVADYSKSQQILVFDMFGRFLYRIGAKGNGKGEYTSINQVDFTDNGVCVLDWLTQRIYYYDWNGEFVKERSTMYSKPHKFITLNEQTIIGTYAGYFEDMKYHVSWINNADEIINTGFPIRNPHPMPAASLLKTNDGDIYFYRTLCDTIYQLTDSQIIPKYKLGLYSNDEIDDFMSLVAGMDMKMYNQTLYDFEKGMICNSIKVWENNGRWVVEHQKGGYVYLSVVDKSNGCSNNYIRSDIKERVSYIPFVFLDISNDCIYTYIDEMFYYQLDEGNREKFYNVVKSEKERNMIREYDIENNNPIVCLFYLKNK